MRTGVAPRSTGSSPGWAASTKPGRPRRPAQLRPESNPDSARTFIDEHPRATCPASDTPRSSHTGEDFGAASEMQSTSVRGAIS
ncbi:MAG: hypothetical protein ABS79_07115 [Planctomycetes bacterium SCN 63-9]|nr:MAG: hypothetical protein ABS79_07115 [Planctomycetes bacterium SCN 63-9]